MALSARVGLNIPSHPTSMIAEKMQKVKTLTPLHQDLIAAEKHVGDATFEAQSAGWDGATVHYSMLRRLAKTDGDLAKALAPVVDYFATKPRTAKADANQGQPVGATASSDATATPATAEVSSAQAPVAPAAAATPPAVTNGAAHS